MLIRQEQGLTIESRINYVLFYSSGSMAAGRKLICSFYYELGNDKNDFDDRM